MKVHFSYSYRTPVQGNISCTEDYECCSKLTKQRRPSWNCFGLETKTKTLKYCLETVSRPRHCLENSRHCPQVSVEREAIVPSEQKWFSLWMEIPADRLSPCDQRLRKVNKIIVIYFSLFVTRSVFARLSTPTAVKLKVSDKFCMSVCLSFRTIIQHVFPYSLTVLRLP